MDAVRQCEALFAAHKRDIDSMLDALCEQEALKAVERSAIVDNVGWLLTISGRNAERRALKVRTLIRDRQSQLKNAGNLWLFSGDASSRVRAMMRKAK